MAIVTTSSIKEGELSSSKLQSNGKKSSDDELMNSRKRKIGRFWYQRRWSLSDVHLAYSYILLHLLTLLAPFHFTWPAFGVFVGMHLLSQLFGITLCYHRCLTHKSFKLPKWLEYTFAYFGLFAAQMDPIWWVSTHRYHHQHCDSGRDPHSPNEGFLFSHFAWALDNDYLTEKCGDNYNNAEDLKSQAFYRFLHKTYFFHIYAVGIALYALGGVPFFLWAAAGVLWTNHTISLVNSLGHRWGSQPWNTGDLSKNNWLMVLLTNGEGWHNNHHAFESSARHGFEWWQIDITWYVIKFLETIGLATNVKLPSDTQKQLKIF